MEYKTSYRKINAGYTVKDQKYVGVGEVGEAEVKSSREQKDEYLQVEVKRRPGRGLMFRH